MKPIIFILTGIFMISLVLGYTAPDFNDINLVLSGTQSPTDFNDINLVLADAPTDTCTCAGLNNNWEVDMEDFCIIVDDCNLGTGKLSFINTGNFTVDAIINTTDMGDPGNGAIVWMNNEGIVDVN